MGEFVNSTKAVSYTHLDVYKRQVDYCYQPAADPAAEVPTASAAVAAAVVAVAAAVVVFEPSNVFVPAKKYKKILSAVLNDRYKSPNITYLNYH